MSDAGANWSSTRFIQIPGVGMGASVIDGVLTLQLTNLHGDAIAIEATSLETTVSAETDEYGNAPAATQGRYGWLGSHERSSDALGGVVLIGARLYNPANAQFLSMDPVAGGGATRYAYPTDPVNGQDLTGEIWGLSKLSNGAKSKLISVGMTAMNIS